VPGTHNSINALWAKKSKSGEGLWLPLRVHLADTAAVAALLWDRWIPQGIWERIASGLDCSIETAKQFFVFLAASHDIGKATPVFQAKQTSYPPSDLDMAIDENLRNCGVPMKPYDKFAFPAKTPHALATQILLAKEGVDKTITVILGAHHGKPADFTALKDGNSTENLYLDKAGKSFWEPVHRELLAHALRESGFSSIRDLPRPTIELQFLLAGLLIVADWIASNEAYFPYMNVEDKQIPDSTCRALEAMDALQLTFPWSAGDEWLHENLYDIRFGFPDPNPMQVSALELLRDMDRGGLLIIEASMGAGKTEAALACGEAMAALTQRSGIFFALPTQATSDGVFPRVLNWIERLDDSETHTVKLAHGKAEFNEDYQSIKLEGSSNIEQDGDASLSDAYMVHEWFDGRKKSLLADFVVGTIDQLLLAALKQKHVMLRHLGLADKVIIIDECHAYDVYMSQYLIMALRWLGAYQTPVIILSATLPAEKREELLNAYRGPHSADAVETPGWETCRDYPLLTFTDGTSVQQRTVPLKEEGHSVDISYHSDAGLEETMAGLLEDGGCAGIIVNTVKRSQEIARRMRACFGDDVVQLFHSRFLTPHRMEKENLLRSELGKPGVAKRPDLRIVVGTQVLEQSLDIDFDVLFTDICPMDLLLQRIGRLHRHNRKRPAALRNAKCFVLGCEGESFDGGAKAVYGEYLLLRTKALLLPKILVPEDISRLVQETYSKADTNMPQTDAYVAARDKWERQLESKEKRAKDFRIDAPVDDTIMGLLSTDVSKLSEARSEAAVRDSADSVEVLLVYEKGEVYRLPIADAAGNEITLPANVMPENEQAKAFAKCSLRLPAALSSPWKIDDTIRQLEEENLKKVAAWQKSPWLRGALFLALNEAGEATIGDYKLSYCQEDGLTAEKEDAN
jgi:CRISPR-associated endonuclease/helicase Cas3